MTMTVDRAARAVSGVARVCATASDEAALLAGLAMRLQPVIDYDAAAWLTTDPATLLFTDGRIEGLGQHVCQPWFDNELLDEDLNKFAVLADRARAAVLSHSEGYEHSPRWRDVMRPEGYDGEVRATFADATGCWGVVELHRDAGRQHFTPDEAQLLVEVAPHVAAGLRRIAVERQALADPRADGPGLILVHDDGTVTAGTEAGAGWLELLLPGPGQQTPTSMHALAALVRDPGERQRTIRLRAADGRWVSLHASPMTTGYDSTAVIVEPTSPYEIGAILALAYGLSEREREVTMAIARGEDTDLIARRLHISPHTVRDHLKASFGKVGASSRTELVARLFHDHYADAFFQRVGKESHT